MRARVIVVERREDADTLLFRLRNGADFSELARENSLDGTAAAGGDLGFARQDMLAPELGAVAFAMAPGQTTAYPIRIGNKWFVAKVEARRAVAAPSFEEARPALERDVANAGAARLRGKALEAAAVAYYGYAGKPPAPAAK